MPKSTVARVRALVEELVNRAVERGEVRRDPIVREVLARFETTIRDGAPIGDREFWHWCGDRAVGQIYNEVIRGRTERPPSQPIFPEFPRVQELYAVVRDGERVAVPVLRLRPLEARRKLAELRAAAQGLLEHADQLELFLENHGVLVNGARATT